VKDLPVEDPEGTRAMPLGHDAELSGKIAPGSLADVLASIEARKRTGTLTVADRQQRGSVHFSQGALVAAEWGALRGDAALQAMRDLAFGSFAFSPEG
jgi:hypothetical protein